MRGGQGGWHLLAFALDRWQSGALKTYGDPSQTLFLWGISFHNFSLLRKRFRWLGRSKSVASCVRTLGEPRETAPVGGNLIRSDLCAEAARLTAGEQPVVSSVGGLNRQLTCRLRMLGRALGVQAVRLRDTGADRREDRPRKRL
jgi:hypothetical protein